MVAGKRRLHVQVGVTAVVDEPSHVAFVLCVQNVVGLLVSLPGRQSRSLFHCACGKVSIYTYQSGAALNIQSNTIVICKTKVTSKSLVRLGLH